MPLVELFTSEGCSSCPPADRLAAKLQAENSAIVLSYHVDYWDRLGWKDPFSEAAFIDRQRKYAQRFSLESTYTPQAVVNGKEELVGSDEKRLRASLEKQGTPMPIAATVLRTALNKVQVSYSLPAVAALWLNVALVQPEATSAVRGGENGGRSLHHVNVVRSLTKMGAAAKGTVDVDLPLALQQSPLSLVVFAQQKNDLAIRGVVQLTVPPFEKKN